MNAKNGNLQPFHAVLAWQAQSLPTLKELIHLPSQDLSRIGLAAMSLICAGGLNGAQDVRVPEYLARVKEWAALVRRETPKYIGSFRKRPGDFKHSQAVFRAMMLVQVLKKNLGVHYNPDRIPLSDDVACFIGFFDSRDLLINGPLGPTRAGTCNNIPMAVVAVGRELGYPLYLATNPNHVYAKWQEPNGESFNIEASNAEAMLVHPDEYYRDNPRPLIEREIKAGCYLRPLTPTEELALCLASRAWVLEAQHRYAEAAPCYAQTLFLSPTDPMYLLRAVRMVAAWLREEDNRGKPDPRKLPPDAPHDLKDDPRTLLPSDGASVALSLLARYYEYCGQTGVAAAMYAEAYRLLPQGRAQRSNSERSIANLAAPPFDRYRVVTPPRMKNGQNDPRFCLGLELGFYSPEHTDPAAAAEASHYGDKLVALGRLAEATLAYGEAIRLDLDNLDHMGKRCWAAKAFVARQAGKPAKQRTILKV